MWPRFHRSQYVCRGRGRGQYDVMQRLVGTGTNDGTCAVRCGCITRRDVAAWYNLEASTRTIQPRRLRTPATIQRNYSFGTALHESASTFINGVGIRHRDYVLTVTLLVIFARTVFVTETHMKKSDDTLVGMMVGPCPRSVQIMWRMFRP